MNSQHNHSSSKFKARSFPITIVCDGLQSPANLGSLFRLCDAFGVKKVVLCGPKIDLNKPRLRKAARATMSELSIEQWNTCGEFLSGLTESNYQAIALEYSSQSIPIEQVLLKPELPILLFIGNENSGVSTEVLNFVDQTLHITMHGVNSSMNVIQATGIALYELTQKLLGRR